MKTTKHRVLCVDDDKDTCEMLSALLSRENCEVTTADGIVQALEMARGDGFSLFILDARLAEKNGDGLELCRSLAQLRPQTPIIFYSGAVFAADKEEGLRAGARTYVVKPLVDELLETVRRLLNA